MLLPCVSVFAELCVVLCSRGGHTMPGVWESTDNSWSRFSPACICGGSGGGAQVSRVVWQLLILFKIKSVSKPFICKIK